MSVSLATGCFICLVGALGAGICYAVREVRKNATVQQTYTHKDPIIGQKSKEIRTINLGVKEQSMEEVNEAIKLKAQYVVDKMPQITKQLSETSSMTSAQAIAANAVLAVFGSRDENVSYSLASSYIGVIFSTSKTGNA